MKDVPVRPTDGSGCPDRRTLADFLDGLLDDPAAGQVATHVAGCGRCDTMLTDLRSDPAVAALEALLRDSLAGPPPAGGPTDQALADWAGNALRAREPADGPEFTLGLDGAAPTVAVAPAGDGPAVATGVGAEVIGPYLLGDLLGQGGMGVVYRARHLVVGRPVALKMIRAGLRAGPEAVERFRTEGKAVALLDHPNVVRLYEFGDHDGVPYYAMELVPGESLAARLKRAGPVGFREAAELVRTMAEAVAHAHAKGVVHRDLKPANVLVAADGTPKVADFGLAKLADDGEARMTADGAILGTANYMAPEQAAGKGKEVGRPADVWALGAILYECLTGRPPFAGESNRETFRLVLEADVVRPARARPGVPRALEEICLKCLEKSQANRYSSAQALATGLDQWLRGERPDEIPGWVGRVARAVRRRKAVVAAGLAAVAAGLVAAAAAHLRDPDRPLRELEAELRQGRPVTLIGETGWPRWCRWLTGDGSYTADPSAGGLRVQSWSVGLLELLPDPGTDRYRFAARVQHTKSDKMGEVGLYVSRRAYPSGGGSVQYFTQLTFNGVRGDADYRAIAPVRPHQPLRDNYATLFPHLYSDIRGGPSFDWRASGAVGPPFKPAGEDNDLWHGLEVTVTPEGVTAGWAGQTLGLTAADLAHRAATTKADLRARLPDDPLVRELVPAFDPRGGLGLYVWRGAATFDGVSVQRAPAVGGH